MLKLLRFRVLVASLDVPDMPPSELFHLSRRAQARLQCFLLDERFTPEDEQRVREAIDPALRAMLVPPPSPIA